ncbi:hypothetical protein KR044_011918 [Drosophila immigrans]|nr:hypothetical protein KR044_011918 [Drosophila immigrans]
MRQNSPNQAPRRKLIPNLFTNILNVIAESDRPLTQHEIVEAVSERLERSDEELKRQITVNLHDAIIYGYLKVRNFRYSIGPSPSEPNEPRDRPDPSSSSHQTVERDHNKLESWQEKTIR